MENSPPDAGTRSCWGTGQLTIPRQLGSMTRLQASNLPMAFGGGAVIGSLGGLMGLGGAEFRLPLLIGPFGFAALESVILNKAKHRTDE